MDLDHWESYYAGGALVSCPTDPEPYYTMEVRDAWTDFFGALGDGARILDLGTGNGAVALIANETAAAGSRNVRIDGIDLARIDPKRHVPDGERLLDGIDFHGGVSTESLPFEDSTFAAISGQYIVEYTDAEKTLREVVRVLAPGGRCQFILHHVDSIIVRNAGESLRQAALVIHETGALETFRRYCEQPDPPRRRDLYDLGERLQRDALASSNPLLLRFVIDAISGMLANRSSVSSDVMRRRTESLERELDHWVRRLEDLVSAALSEEAVRRLARLATALGFTGARVDVQRQGDEHVVGWRMAMVKPDARSG